MGYKWTITAHLDYDFEISCVEIGDPAAVWILENGTWNDDGIWIDSETWNDN